VRPSSSGFTFIVGFKRLTAELCLILNMNFNARLKIPFSYAKGTGSWRIGEKR
jgi:hypothetical protein